MHFLLLILLFQEAPAPSATPDLTAAHGASVPLQKGASTPVTQILAKPTDKTTPTLSADSELITHAQMERDIGAQASDIGYLKSEVDHLQKQRDDPDRKDIDDLKDSRNHIEWTWGILTTVFLTMAAVLGALYGKFKTIILEDSVKPRIKRYVASLLAEGKAPPPLRPS